LKNFRDRAFYRYGLRSADQLIVQTKKQQAMLKNGFGLEALVLPMPCPDPAASLPPAAGPRSGRVLWLARACRQKRPDRLLDLAEACPEIGFDLVGPFYADAYAQGVLRRAQGIGNVTVHGAAGRDRVAVFYQNAACLCNTSDYEGFPNTFLEAWSWGLPVVSMFDPDSLLAGKNLGLAVADIPAMAGAVRSLLASPGRWEEISRNARQYFVENHRVETVLPKFEDVFAAVARRRN
jgi:glycosyltransferase involved in cell wall biosynthesis